MAPGGLITAGRKPNPWGDTFDDHGRSVYVYATEDLGTAQVYAETIRKQTGRRAYVYEVEPTGKILPDVGAADFRSKDPLRVIRKIR